MATREEILRRLDDAPDAEYAVAIWCTEDVIGRAEERRDMGNPYAPIPTLEQAKEILRKIDYKQDCGIGITWETIEYYTDDYFATLKEKGGVNGLS